MFYGSTTIGGVPWESVIKEFRRALGRKSFPELKDYAEAFLRFLTSCGFLFPEASQRDIFAYNAWEALARLFEIQERPTAASVGRALDAEIERLQKIEPIEGMDADFGAKLLDVYDAEIRDAMERIAVLGAEPSAAIQDKVRTLVRLRFTCRESLPRSSGIVIAGFGSSEVFPSVLEFSVDAVVGGRVRWWCTSAHAIDERRKGIVVPFANKDVIDIIIHGIHPKVELLFLESSARLLLSIPEVIISQIAEIGPEAKDGYLKAASEAVKVAFKELAVEILEQRRRDIEEPIVKTIENLPPTELVTLAEVLLSVSQIYQRVTPDVETVAGPIDVAIISKYEGFIWVKRKQYIDAGLNPGFVRQYLDR
ncbi:hypothetical protein D8770_25185 [Methylobacterium sp. DB1607]|nr:hypothetical protein [Methylobacterium sp. DB1607]